MLEADNRASIISVSRRGATPPTDLLCGIPGAMVSPIPKAPLSDKRLAYSTPQDQYVVRESVSRTPQLIHWWWPLAWVLVEPTSSACWWDGGTAGTGGRGTGGGGTQSKAPVLILLIKAPQ